MQKIIPQVISAVIYFIELLLLVRFLLKLFSASTNSGFVSWIYASTASFVSPFQGILANIRYRGFTLDFASIIAMIFFIIIGQIIVSIITRIQN